MTNQDYKLPPFAGVVDKYMNVWTPENKQPLKDGDKIFTAEDVQAAYRAGLEAAPLGWQLVPINPTPDMRQILLRADEFTVNELYILILAASPKPSDVKTSPLE